MTLALGTRLDDGQAVELPADALLRHVVALGASGSGKTVFCKAVVEEAVCAGIPVICLDPQGDLASLALADGALAERAEVVLFTPASRKGVPLCADPLDGSLAELDAHERVQAQSRMGQMVASLLGYDLDTDDGAGLASVLDVALGELVATGAPLRLELLAEHMRSADEERLARYGELLDRRKLSAALKRLARLDVGARRLLFHDGIPVDVDLLLGLGDRAPVAPGRTRVSVIYLNTLHAQEDKELFLAVIADRLYRWMLAHPSSAPQALFYVDEVAPYLPPVRKPACKDTLALLLRQARKYGVSCLLATQNPGDLDYKALAQIGTWALGRMTTRQDRKKIEPAVKSMAPDDAEGILEALPSRQPGELTLIAPDAFAAPVTLATRRLMSEHRTLDEEAIGALADPFRDRFPIPAAAPAPVPAPAPAPVPAPAPAPVPAPAPAPAPAADPLAAYEPLLLEVESVTARELATAAGIGEKKARRILTDLVAAGRARAFKRGRARAYFPASGGSRPDLGLGPTVASVVPSVGRERAEELARSHIRARLFGLLDDKESFAGAELLYRPVYQLEVEEHVPRGALARLVGKGPDHVRGTIYLHPTTLHVLTFDARDGISFALRPAEHATSVVDLDGSARFEDVAPGSLPLDEAAVIARRPPTAAEDAALELFPTAKVGTIALVFIPLWRLALAATDASTHRLVTIDAIAGRPVDWPVD